MASMETKETGHDTGRPITLASLLAAQRRVEKAEAATPQRRAERDDMIRAALAAGITTKAELHRELGISEQHLGRIEQGRTSGAIPPQRLTDD